MITLRRIHARSLCLAIASLLVLPGSFVNAEPIKIGILHSLSGTMAVSEAPLKDVMLMLIEKQNEQGGVLGRKLEAVVVDPASDWSLFADKAKDLIAKHEVDVVFGCWTSASRKSVVPVFERLNGLLFYPVQYEGEESSRNVFYLGAAPNQQAIPAVNYLMSNEGGSTKRWVLVGTDYVYPRTTNRIVRAYLHFRGVADFDIREVYTPFGHSDWQSIVSDIRRFAAAGLKTAVVSTINGDANAHFFAELVEQGVTAKEIPIIAFSIGEGELANLDTGPLVGNLTAWNYFMSVDTPQNKAFIDDWKAYINDDTRVTNDPMEAHYIGFKMWVQAVRQAGTTDVDAVRQAMYGQKVGNLTGSIAVMNTNHHLSKPVLIGEIQADGQMRIVWTTEGVVKGDTWSDFIPETAKLTADWSYPWVCGKCERPTFGSLTDWSDRSGVR